MADVNAISIEELPDRIIYRYPGGEYLQSVTGFVGALSTGAKTLVNTDIARSYVVPASSIPAKFFVLEISIFACAQLTETVQGIGIMNLPWKFLKVTAPELNYDGRSLQIDFLKETTRFFVPSTQLRALNITNITMEPMISIGDVQSTGLSAFAYSNGGVASNLRAIIQPTITKITK